MFYYLVKGPLLVPALGKTEISTPSVCRKKKKAIVRSLARMQNCANLFFESSGGPPPLQVFPPSCGKGVGGESLLLTFTGLSSHLLEASPEGDGMAHPCGFAWHLPTVV